MWSTLEHKWHSSHLSHRGSYSIERLQAFDEYCQQTPLLQVIGVCLVLPLPALIVSILVECTPLQNPLDGWKVNWGYWIRFFFGNLFVGLGFLIQVKEMVSALNMTLTEVFAIGVSSTSLTLGLYVLISNCWVFPVPFGLVLMCTPYVIILILTFMVVIGRERFQKNPDLKHELTGHARILVVMSSLFLVYPAFGAIYNALPPNKQTFFIILLPIIKAIMNNVVAYAARNVVEIMPGIALMSVEVFNALYSAKCMQNAGSSITYVAILSWDLFESVMAFRDIRSQVAQLHDLVSQHKGLSSDKTLVQFALELCLEPGVLNSNSRLSIKSRSVLRLKTSASSREMLKKVEYFMKSPPSQLALSTVIMSSQHQHFKPKHHSTGAECKKNESVFLQQYDSNLKNPNMPAEKVRPATMTLNGIAHPNQAIQAPQQAIHNDIAAEKARCTIFGAFRHKIRPTAIPDIQVQRRKIARSSFSADEKHMIIKQTLDILFQCEFYVLVEFVECAIPLMYALYMVVLFHLPSVKYYPDTINMTTSELQLIVINITIYASLEIISLIVLHFVIKWKFGFSPVHILAFVLKNQFFEFQGRLVVWYLYVLELMLYHCGVDFTLRFEWMHHDRN